MGNKKTILFNCHTAYTFILSSIIGELYYKDDDKILITSFEKNNKGFWDNVIAYNMFKEVYSFNCEVKGVSQVEEQVDDLISILPRIDEYFFCVFSDRFSTLIARRLSNTSVINVFPEGSSNINIEKSIHNVFEYIYNKKEYIKRFYDKYPIDFKLYDYFWVIANNTGKKNTDKTISIQLEKILYNEKFIDNINKLFNYEETLLEHAEIVFIEDATRDIDGVFDYKEKEIYKFVFDSLSDYDIYIKAHPAQKREKEYMMFDFPNAIIYEKQSIPWEIICINLFKKQNKKILMIVPTISTALYSTFEFLNEQNYVIVISLYKLLEPYIDEFTRAQMKAIYDASKPYFKRKSNFSIKQPNGITVLYSELSKYLGNKIKNIQLREKNDFTVDYFNRVGNLVEKSCLHIHDSSDSYFGYYDYLERNNKVTFIINKKIKETKVSWIPSCSNILTGVDFILIKCELDNEDITIEEYCINNNVIEFEIPSAKYNKIEISFDSHTAIKIRDIQTERYKSDFWEQWYFICEGGFIRNIKMNSEIWIFGDGLIGKEIQKKMLEQGIESKLLASRSNNDIKGKIYTIDEVEALNVFPSLIVITTMNDFYEIYYKFNYKYRKKIVSLFQFIDRIVKINE